MTPGQSGDTQSRPPAPLAVAVDVAGWIRERSPGIAERWASGLLANGESWATGNRSVARPLCRGLVSFLPGMLGPYREQILPLWSEGAELFGSVAARRGLSAGEVIDEFQLLREVILMMMFERPPGRKGRALPLREVLHLNRALDIGVTRASVGHTDLLFFSLIHDSGVPAPLRADDLKEVCEQIRTLQAEGHRIMGYVARRV